MLDQVTSRKKSHIGADVGDWPRTGAVNEIL